MDPFSWIQHLLPLVSTLYYYGTSAYFALTTKAGNNAGRVLSGDLWKAIMTIKTGILLIYGIEAIILTTGSFDDHFPSSEPRTMFICGSTLSWIAMVLGVSKTPGYVAAQYCAIWLTYAIGEIILLFESLSGHQSSHWYLMFHTAAQILKLLSILTLCLVYIVKTCSSKRRNIDDERQPLLSRDPTEQNQAVIQRVEKMLRISIKYLWPEGQLWQKVKVAQIVFITGLDTTLNVIVPQQMGYMIDELNTSNGTVWVVFAYIMLQFLHSKLISMIRSSIWASHQRAAEEKLFIDTYQHAMHLSMDFYDGVVSGTDVERGRSVGSFAQFVFLEIIPNMLRLVSTITFLISDFGHYMGLIIAAVLLILTSIAMESGPSLYEECGSVGKKKFLQLQYSFSNWMYIYQFNQIDAEVEKYAELVNRSYTLDNAIDRSSKRKQLIQSLTFIGGSLAACIYVFTLAKGDGLSSGNILRLIAYWEGLSGSIIFFDNKIKQIKKKANSVKAFMELLERRPTITDKEDARPLVITHGVVEFKNVSFRVLQGISFKCGQGQMVACVGRNGAGKSTMMKLLARFYDPDTGSIEIDGQNITQVTTASLRDQLYLLTQHSPRLGMTIRENLRYCLPGVTEEQVYYASAEVGLDDLNKCDSDLSGGELQKLALARAIIRDPKIFLLDEPTSSLDNTAQESYRHTLAKIALGRTAFVVAHRLLTIKHADLILVFDKGQIVQQGTHEDLVKLKGLYRELWVAEYPEQSVR